MTIAANSTLLRNWYLSPNAPILVYVEVPYCEYQMDTEEQTSDWTQHSCDMTGFVGRTV